ncbi:type VI immunity family protein [Acinetobacter piscicola]|uniref:DUF3396 domain-containing protein n=1 Tax=Acinetobacter piscicola TaxID=2006115 RepID=A0A7S7AH00_9GAMM|nr:type VI immunity family protein [Acinetobacter piscicola]QOW45454.1 DUF3396 domain-containing protein [Acinetobacter piscicola]
MKDVELKVPEQQDLIFELKKAERELRLIDDQNRPLAKLALTIQLYYLDGATAESKRKALEIIAQFKQKYASHLKAQFTQNNRGFVKFNEKNYQSFLKKAEQNIQANDDLFTYYLSSDEDGEFADDYVLEFFTAYPDSEPATDQDLQLSYASLTLPVSMIETKEGLEGYQQWIHLFIHSFSVFHGYAGLTLKTPYDRHPFQSYEYDITHKYWGITPDGGAFFKHGWQTGLRSISWQTFIGARLKDKVIQQPYYQETLKNYPDVKSTEINGCLILQAGDIPRLANVKEPLPLSYVVVNQLCRIIMTKKPLGPLHTGSQGPLYSYTQTYYWLHRWNNDNFEKGIFNPQGKKQELLHVLGESGYDHQPVPYSGMWKPFDFEGLSQHLTVGQEFPEEAKYIRKSGRISSKNAVWCLEKRDDHGPVLLPNPF